MSRRVEWELTDEGVARFLSLTGDPDVKRALNDRELISGWQLGGLRRLIAEHVAVVRERECKTCGGTGTTGVLRHLDPATGAHLGDEDILCTDCKDGAVQEEQEARTLPLTEALERAVSACELVGGMRAIVALPSEQEAFDRSRAEYRNAAAVLAALIEGDSHGG